MNRRTDGHTCMIRKLKDGFDGWVDGWHRWIYRQTEGHIGEQTDRWMKGGTEVGRDGGEDGLMRQTDERKDGLIGG